MHKVKILYLEFKITCLWLSYINALENSYLMVYLRFTMSLLEYMNEKIKQKIKKTLDR